MLPFPIINQYGNIIPQNDIIDIQVTGRNSTAVLLSSGELYGFGYNSSGELGQGVTTPINTMTLLDTGVTNVYGGSFSFLYKKDNKYYTSGEGSFYGSTTVSTTTFTDITYIFSSIDTTTIKKIVFDTAMFILLYDGTLYACGVNNSGCHGDGSTARKSVPSVVQTGVSDIKVSANATFILKNNRIYSAGQNGDGQLGCSTATTVSTFTLVDKFPYVASLDNLGVTSRTSYYNDNGTVYGTGLGTNYQFGDGSNASSYSLFSKVVPVPSTFIGRLIDTKCTANGPIVCCNDGFYFTGTNPYGIYGTGTSSTYKEFTKMASLDTYISDYSTVQLMNANFYGLYFNINDKLYGAGQASAGAVPGYSVIQRTYVPLEIPKLQ